jgi:hypothetical protein
METTKPTIEDLLKPRIKIIALWPICRSHNNMADQPKVGQVFKVAPDGSISSNAITVLNVDKYPHLFEKLSWWEEMDLSEFPEYVKPNPEKEFMKTENWIYKANWIMSVNGPAHRVNQWNFIHAENLLPCTESDYLTYTSQP